MVKAPMLMHPFKRYTVHCASRRASALEDGVSRLKIKPWHFLPLVTPERLITSCKASTGIQQCEIEYRELTPVVSLWDQDNPLISSRRPCWLLQMRPMSFPWLILRIGEWKANGTDRAKEIIAGRLFC